MSRSSGRLVEVWRDWLAAGGPKLQLHVNLREPVGRPGLRILAATALRGIEDQIGLDLGAVWGVFQPNSHRDGVHMHALLFGPDEMRRARRDVVWAAVRERATTLHTNVLVTPDLTPEPNAAMVRLLPVFDRGEGVASLTTYIVRYLLRYAEGEWFEVGELGRYLPVTSDTPRWAAPFMPVIMRGGTDLATS